jgi:hypothetical protein
LISALKNYFPHVLQWLQDKDTGIFCDFLNHWPTLKAAPLARRTTLERFFQAHHVRSTDIIQQRDKGKAHQAAVRALVQLRFESPVQAS